MLIFLLLLGVSVFCKAMEEKGCSSEECKIAEANKIAESCAIAMLFIDSTPCGGNLRVYLEIQRSTSQDKMDPQNFSWCP